MKELQRKKPVLRSLRGKVLAILCVIAAAFAAWACSSGVSDDEGDDGGKSTADYGKRPIRLDYTSGPATAIYQGLPMDLAGYVATITYSDGTQKTVRNPAELDTYPHYGTGWLDGNNVDNFYGASYRLTYSENGYEVSAPLTVATIGFSRTNARTLVQTMDGLTTNNPGWNTSNNTLQGGSNVVPPGTDANVAFRLYSANGLQGIGVTTLEKREYYVDELVPNFKGITLEAHYTNGQTKPIPLSSVLDDRHVRWEVRPRYTAGNGSGAGDLYVTVGINPDAVAGSAWVHPNYSGNSYVDPGLTVTFPLARVHQVSKFEFANKPNIEGNTFYYFSADDHGGWSARSAGATFNVSYTNGVTNWMTAEEGNRPYTIGDLEYINSAPMGGRVWWNDNPSFDRESPLGRQPFYIEGIRERNRRTGGNWDDDVDSIKNPTITYYYRGWTQPLEWPVYTKVARMTVDPQEVQEVDMSQRQDNDNRTQTMTAAIFSNRLTVNVVWTSPNASAGGREATMTARFWAGPSPNNAGSGSSAAAWIADMTARSNESELGAPYNSLADRYTMNFGEPTLVWSGGLNSSNVKAGGWGECYNAANNDRNGRTVRIYYATPPSTWAGTDVGSKLYRGTVPVMWRNIPNYGSN